MNKTIEADIVLMQRMADVADKLLANYFRHGIEVEQKSDLSPVTVADREAERTLRQMLAEDRPRDGILGEEFGDRPAMTGRTWVIDPIDGTRSFISGRQLYGTLIALFEDGRPLLGMISAGAAGDRWLGCLNGIPYATYNGEETRVRECESLSLAHAATTAPHLFSASGHAAFGRISRSVADMLFGGDCHNYGLLASGGLDLVMEEGLQPYDWAAHVPIIIGAGGIITDWQGKPLTLASEGQVLAAGDSRVHEEALARI